MSEEINSGGCDRLSDDNRRSLKGDPEKSAPQAFALRGIPQQDEVHVIDEDIVDYDGDDDPANPLNCEP